MCSCCMPVVFFKYHVAQTPHTKNLIKLRKKTMPHPSTSSDGAVLLLCHYIFNFLSVYVCCFRPEMTSDFLCTLFCLFVIQLQIVTHEVAGLYAVAFLQIWCSQYPFVPLEVTGSPIPHLLSSRGKGSPSLYQCAKIINSTFVCQLLSLDLPPRLIGIHCRIWCCWWGRRNVVHMTKDPVHDILMNVLSYCILFE